MVRIMLLVLVLIALGVGGYYIAREQGYFGTTIPFNPPTADDLRRLEEIERSSATVDPNAAPGASVRPPGSLPRPVEATSTATSSEVIDVSATSSEEVAPETE